MTRTLVAFALIFSATLIASTSFASRSDLINDALNKNLEERDQVTGTYKQNDAAERPVAVEKRTKEDRIPVVMESELMGSVSHNLRDYDNPSRTYKESHVEAHLDREVKDVDHSFDKQQTQDSQKSSVRALLDVEG
jgi:Arc/MetJ-type ribon-helix-helix transcriptional regulator